MSTKESVFHEEPNLAEVNRRKNGMVIGFRNLDAEMEVRSRIAKALKDPKMKPVSDYLEFLDAAVIANHRIFIETGEKDKGEPFTYDSRDYPGLEQMKRAFLKHYPKSKKCEAVRLLLARAVFRQSWPWIERLGVLSTAGGFGIYPQEFSTKFYQREPFKPKRVLAELDAYDKDFPNGRYAEDILSMRASTLWRTEDWKTALDITVNQLEHATFDLRRDAAFRLANIFAELANPDHRPAVLNALRGNHQAIMQLREYLKKAEGKRDHPLVMIGEYLQDQLGFKLPPTSEKKTNP